MSSFKGFHMNKKQRDCCAADSEVNQKGRKPTHAELERSGYRKGLISWNGVPINVENPKGSVRSGDGWSIEFKCHYGEFVGAIGKDGDGVDVFVGDSPTSKRIYVFNQYTDRIMTDDTFDEHKVFAGFNSLEQAKTSYADHHTADWEAHGTWVEIYLDELKRWLTMGDKRKPIQLDSWDWKLVRQSLRKNP